MIILTHKHINETSISPIQRDIRTEDGFRRLNRTDIGRSFENCTGKVATIYGFVDPQEIVQTVKNAKNYIKDLSPALKTIIGNCNIVYTGRVGTMATDGMTIFINPGFVKHLGDKTGNADKAVAYVIAHEALHVLFDHCKQYEMQKKEICNNHDKANAAMDCEVNWFIEHYIRSGKDYIFKDWHDLLDGWWDEEDCKKGYLWEKIFKNIVMPSKKKEKMVKSPAWIRGFVDGYKYNCAQLRKMGKIQ